MRAGTILKGAAGIGVSIFLALTVLALAFFLLSPHLLDTEFFTVMGGSMSPAIPLGAVVVVRPAPPADIQIGDVIVFGPQQGQPGPRVVHRVVATETSASGTFSLITKGDASGSQDQQLIHPENVIGRVWFYIPFLGYLWAYSRMPLVFILLVATPALALIAMEVARLLARARNRRQAPP